MALKGRYLVELRESSPGAAEAGRACARLEGDAILAEAARGRVRYGKDDRWWSVPAGVMLVALCAIYSMGWTVVALCAAAAIALYIAAVFTWMGIKRSRLRRIDTAISPQRGADALMRMALRLPPSGRDITRLFPDSLVGEFSEALFSELTRRARECGVDPVDWSLKTETGLRDIVSEARDMIAIPIFYTVTASGNGNQCQFILEYMAAFACAATGDYIPLDCSPSISMVTPLKAPTRPDTAVQFKKCPHCGWRQSDRALKTRDGHCLGCREYVL